MKKHICKQCNKVYEYCRGCLLSPISYKENGYCSKTCYEASKIKVEPIVEEIIEVISSEDIVPMDTEAIDVEEASMEIESETVVPTEEITVEETTIKQETYNAYKKKKKKHR